ncbi:MAG: PP2C family protein-serine/threonine phosphatase [Anaerolineales bacterium]|jgi:serine phosphatase RsbU (regulator of sigma subunit)
MEAQVAAAKTSKYASSESGDTLEMVERPEGGISFVLVDGQRSGKPAKRISNVVARKAISLLAEGVRDGAAARAASDYLYTYRGGKVMATLNILSIDLSSRTCVITRNNPAPVVLAHGSVLEVLDDPVDPVGVRRSTRPSIREVPLEEGLMVVVFTDGLMHAGDRRGHRMDVLAEIQQLAESERRDPNIWADRLLQRALELDDNRPVDDISILVAATLANSHDSARRLWARMPL